MFPILTGRLRLEQEVEGEEAEGVLLIEVRAISKALHIVFEKEKGHSSGYKVVNSRSSSSALETSSELIDIDFLNGALSLILLVVSVIFAHSQFMRQYIVILSYFIKVSFVIG